MSKHRVANPDVARAVAAVADGCAHSAVLMPAEHAHHSIKVSRQPGILWAEILSGTQRVSGAQARALTDLGWRPPSALRAGWYQYFHPTRRRHQRAIAEHLARTLRRGLGASAHLEVASVDRSEPGPVEPTFSVDEAAAGAPDEKLLEVAAMPLDQFEPDVFPSHIELTMIRRRHHVRIGVFAYAGTLTCCALHLPDVPADVAAAALAVNDRLDRVAHTYAVREVRGHGRSLVLQSKISLVAHQRIPPIAGMLLYTTIEPLVDAHRALHR